MIFNKNSKNNLMLKAIACISLAASSILLSSCFSPVFSSVRKEVKLESAQINGFINSIVRFTDSESGDEYLYLQNGRIYYKKINDENGGLTENASYNKWKYDKNAPAASKYDFNSTTYSGYIMYKLASDSNYLYALGYRGVLNETYSRNEPRDVKLFFTKKAGADTEWNEISTVNEAIEKYIDKLGEKSFMMDASIQLFCTNTPKKEHRKAFLRIGGGDPYVEDVDANAEENYGNAEKGNYGIITLNGDETELTAIPFGTNGANFQTVSAVWFDEGDGDDTNNVHFLNCVAAVTDESRLSEATRVYFGDGKVLKNFSVASYNGAGAVKVLEKTVEKAEGSSEENVAYKETDFTINKIDAYLSAMVKWSEGEGSEREAVSVPEGIIGESKGAAANILSLCATKDSVIIGSYEQGVYRVPVTDGVPAEKTESFDDSNNAETIMTTPYIIRMVFCTDPSLGEMEKGQALYSSMQFRYTQNTASADYDNVGLWAYYFGRGWNRE